MRLRPKIKFMFISCLATFNLSANLAAEEEMIGNTLQYMTSVVSEDFYNKKPNDVSISFYDIEFKEDSAALTSFSDAYLWASGVRTHLKHSAAGDMVIVYLNDFEQRESIDFKDDLLNSVYKAGFSKLKDGGSCTKLIVTDEQSKNKRNYVFVSKKTNFDERASCIYRHYRSLFGLSERYRMQSFGETLIADLRLLSCKKTSPFSTNFMPMIKSGEC